MNAGTVDNENNSYVRYQTIGSNGLESTELARLPAVFQTPDSPYAQLYYMVKNLNPSQFAVLTEMASTSQSGYDDLAGEIAQFQMDYPQVRILLALPDGTVVYDSSEPVGSGPGENSYTNFLNKSINENHNTRVSIMNAQLSPLGFGYERKLSTTTGEIEIAFARRLGERFNNAGTLRLSMPQVTN